MTIVAAVSMMKDEADVAADTILHLVEERVDVVIVADNNSTDGTREILEDLVPDVKARNSELVIVDDPEPGYYQSRKITELANRAHHEFGATWIIPFDADEIWYSRDAHLGDALREAKDSWAVGAQIFNHFATHLDTEDESPFRSMVYRQPGPGALPKVAVRWQENLVIHQGNHAASVDGLELSPTPLIGLRHFPYRSADHFLRKARNGAAAYAAADLGKHEGAHWRQYGELIDRYGEQTVIDDVYMKYFHFVSPTNEGLIHDPAPFRRWA